MSFVFEGRFYGAPKAKTPTLDDYDVIEPELEPEPQFIEIPPARDRSRERGQWDQERRTLPTTT